MRTTTMACVVTMALTGCIDTNVRQPSNMGPLLAPNQTDQGLSQERPPTFLKRHSAHSSRMSRKVSIKSAGMPLARILSTVVPDMNVRIMDPGVDLSRKTSLYVTKTPLHSFFDQLTDITDYDFTLEDDTLEISSRITQTWNLAALASNRQSTTSIGGQTGIAGTNNNNNNNGGFQNGNNNASLSSNASVNGGASDSVVGGGNNTGGDRSNGTSVRSVSSQDHWKKLVKQVKRFVGLNVDENQDNNNALAPEQKPRVVAVRTLGTISVTGKPHLIRSVGRFLGRVAKQSTRQIHLDVKAYEVSVDDERAHGINWQAILNTTSGGSAFSAIAKGVYDVALDKDSGKTTVSGKDVHGNDSASAMVKLLSHYGNVELLTEPNLTELNGGTAYISSVDESSFVSSVTQFVATQGSNTVTPQISRIRVGVTMSVTSRILPDNRILMEVTPVISSLKGLDNFSIGKFQFSNPRIALSELTTQVITRPGQTVQLGGLITSRVKNALNGLPVRRKTGLLNWLFSSGKNTLTRRELVLTIKPTLVES